MGGWIGGWERELEEDFLGGLFKWRVSPMELYLLGLFGGEKGRKTND